MRMASELSRKISQVSNSTPIPFFLLASSGDIWGPPRVFNKSKMEDLKLTLCRL